MRPAALEHVNITVTDPQRTAAMLEELFGWKIRWEGASAMGGRTIHVGTEDAYVAVYANGSAPRNGRLNHIGVVVDDLDAAEKRVAEAGFAPHSHGAYAPGRRFYFDDRDGIEFEVVSYG